MKITILGSGTCVPSLHRSSCAAFIESGDDRILCDIGAGTIRRLLEAGIHINSITHLLISHLHPDHTGELASFLFSSKYPRQMRGPSNPLTLIAGKGFTDFFNTLKTAYKGWISLPENVLKIVELDNSVTNTLKLNTVLLLTAPVSHNPESMAFRVENKPTSVVYSGDTDYCDSLITLSTNADLLICESAMPDSLKVDNHLTPSTAGSIAAKANVNKLVLTHFYPECDKSDIAKECRTAYDGELVLAEDLMVFNV